MSEIIFGSSVPLEAYRLKKLQREKKIRKISPRLYTLNLTDDPEVIVRRNLFKILGNLYPGAVLSHRSALEKKPTNSNKIFITHSYTKKIKLPGITIQFLEGNEADEDDLKVMGNLYASSKERAFLENLQLSKKSGSDSKSLGADNIKERLRQILTIQGEDELMNVKEKAQELSEKLRMKREFEILSSIIEELIL